MPKIKIITIQIPPPPEVELPSREEEVEMTKIIEKRLLPKADKDG